MKRRGGKTHERWRGEGERVWEMKRRGGESVEDEEMKDEMWERERESEKEGRMTWTFVDFEIMTWWYLIYFYNTL